MSSIQFHKILFDSWGPKMASLHHLDEIYTIKTYEFDDLMTFDLQANCFTFEPKRTIAVSLK